MVRTGGSVWPDDGGAPLSVVTEPLALRLVLWRLHPDVARWGYILVTDHLPIAEAFRNGSSPNVGCSQCVRTLSRADGLRDIRHIEGRENNALTISPEGENSLKRTMRRH